MHMQIANYDEVSATRMAARLRDAEATRLHPRRHRGRHTLAVSLRRVADHLEPASPAH